MGDGHPERVLDLDLPAEPASSPRARHAVQEALAGRVADIAAVSLAVTEAVTNVVVHAYRERDHGRVRVAITLADGAASVVVADDGAGMAPRPDSPGLGLGLSLIANLCDNLSIDQREDGTSVRMSFACTADAQPDATDGEPRGT